MSLVSTTALKLNEIKKYVYSNVLLQCQQLAAPRLAIQGPPGCGKSDLIRQICLEKQWYLSVKYLSNMSLEQITGIPCRVLSGSTAIWSKPELFNFDNCEYQPTNKDFESTAKILLIDDFHLADKIVQKYLFQLLTYKSLNGYHLPPNTAIILAGNRNTDRAGAQPIPAPVCNRMMFIEVRGDVKDWLVNFAFKNNIRSDITSYLHHYDYNNDLFSGLPIESAPWASPRSWTYLSYQIDTYLKCNGPIDINTLRVIATGLVGNSDAVRFILYRELFSKWDFLKLSKLPITNAIKLIDNALSKKYTSDAYGIINSGVTWLINVYKNNNFDHTNKDLIKSVLFFYHCITYMLSYSNDNIRTSIRPLVATGCKYILQFQQSTGNSGNQLLSLLFDQMKQQRDVDWLFYLLIATVTKFKLTDDDISNILKAKITLGLK